MDKFGLIHIYCGDGKGKTTTSIGATVRAVGSGANVLFVQLLKSGNSSELTILKGIKGIVVEGKSPVQKFSYAMSEQEKEICKKYNNDLIKSLTNEKLEMYDMLVIDECLGAIDTNLLDETILVELLDTKRATLEVILTGRNPSKELLERADYVSEITKIKHPYDKKINARKGIER
ncbi:MAG: cob(I)yrinic acid a,c-diamide adenosyltransferase [Lachnospiraceae bacterium]